MTVYSSYNQATKVLNRFHALKNEALVEALRERALLSFQRSRIFCFWRTGLLFHPVTLLWRNSRKPFRMTNTVEPSWPTTA